VVSLAASKFEGKKYPDDWMEYLMSLCKKRFIIFTAVGKEVS
jgi:hypothetical protein